MQKIKSYCSVCRNNTNHDKLFEKEVKSAPYVDDFGWSFKYIIVECCGCSNVSFRREYGDENMVMS